MISEPATGARERAPRPSATRIVDCAMRQFAEDGYQGAKVEDIASELGIAKGSIFQHFGSKSGLFLEAYKRAVVLAARLARRAAGRCGPRASSPP